MLLQKYYAKQACDEANIVNPKIRINHRKGEVVINGKRYGIVLPRSLVDYCKTLWSERTDRFYFKGVITAKRQWVRQYDNVHASNRGRNKNLKYKYDQDYFESLARTEFALAPTGGCNWSYRMFEAIACGAMPVLGDNDTDLFAEDYNFVRHSDEKEYSIEHANHNFETLLQKTLL